MVGAGFDAGAVRPWDAGCCDSGGWALRTRQAKDTVPSGRLPASAAAPKAAARPTPRQARKRGTFTQTAEEMILSLLKGRKAMTTSQLAAAWKKAGRGGAVDNALSRMVKAKLLKRKSLGGKLGSEYRAG